MTSTALIYTLGLIGTGGYLLVTGWATFSHRRAARRYIAYMQRMPQAVEYEHLETLLRDRREQLDLLVRERQEELEELIRRSAGAAESVQRKEEAEQWLRDHEAQAAVMRADQQKHQQLTDQLESLLKQNEENRTLYARFKLTLETLEGKIKLAENQEKDVLERIERARQQAGIQEQELAARVEVARQSALTEEGELRKRVEVAREQVEAKEQEARQRIRQIQNEELLCAERLQEVERQLTTAQERFATLHMQAAALEEELKARHEAARKDQEAEAAAARQRHSQLCAQLNAELADSRKTKEDLENSLAEMRTTLANEALRVESSRAEVIRLTAESEGQQSRIKDLREDIVRLQEDYRSLGKAVGRTAEPDNQRTVELWEPLLQQPSQRLNNEDENERLEKVEEYLNSRGLRFHPRVLHAFHTTLKVADISPLVVLAGISGTGKSELPRRYAEAMGMHYLCLPVQPRWDSPQDMFGFYNYLENRYRSTELSRALIQMDPFFAETDRGWSAPEGWEDNSLHDQMLLVLLDEMNLARVEYYFSEFLSRLETRRGINRTDAQDRRKAEVVLETGAGGKGAPTMRLFVDTNVVFVGTMNEDESTQTLSDKVVDRSNVLRFGRPQKLTKDENAYRNGEAQATSSRLLYKNWQRWIKADSPGAEWSEQVDRWIGRLNEALARIHRPFAHRTHQSIRAYVANYPQFDDESWLHQAMADQIEQKILPKFRGIDVEDRAARTALDALREVVKELGDDKLQEAIDRSRQDQQFTWNGVDRALENEEAAR